MTISLGAFLVACAMSVAWAGFDAARKKFAPIIGPIPLVAGVTFGITMVYVTWMVAGASPFVDWPRYWPWAALIIAMNIMANLFFIRAVTLSPLSIVVPILAFSPVFTVLVAFPLIGEWPTIVQIGGIWLVVLGAGWLNLPASEWGQPWRYVGAIARERGSLWMLVTAFLWSMTAVLDKLVLGNHYVSMELHAAVQLGGICLPLMVWLAVRGQLSQLAPLWQRPVSYAAAVVAGAAAMALQLIALTMMYVAFLEAIKRSIGMTAAVINGRWMFAEPITAGKILGVTLMTAGVVIILTGDLLLASFFATPASVPPPAISHLLIGR